MFFWYNFFIVLGLLNAVILYWQYLRSLRGQKMVCLIGGDCMAVVSSPYGKTLGIKNEIIGVLYYLFLLITLIIGVQYPWFFPKIYSAHFLANFFALSYSVYLFLLQNRVLKKYCSWCIISGIINLALFVFSTYFFTRSVF